MEKLFFCCVADVGMYFVLDILKLLKVKNKIHNKFYLGIGFEEKSTTWRDWHSLIASGMSPMSETEK